MMLQVGDLVRMSEAGRSRWGNSDYNPNHLEGELLSVDWDANITCHVKWSNGNRNSYREIDLEYASLIGIALREELKQVFALEFNIMGALRNSPFVQVLMDLGIVNSAFEICDIKAWCYLRAKRAGEPIYLGLD